jgi:hypothetical protein
MIEIHISPDGLIEAFGLIPGQVVKLVLPSGVYLVHRHGVFSHVHEIERSKEDGTSSAKTD